ncbi:MAG: peptide-methionine (S)-S-oxide reductase MsrA [Aggregatilineales bacterium]
MTKEIATLGGGCFWCLEAVYDRLQGVTKVESGYSGGHVVNPTYREVCNKTTGHAEVVQVTFDTDDLSFREVLEVFFSTHDPTTLNRQGNDVGPQYRSAIYYHSDAQKQVTEAFIQELTDDTVFKNPIVTEVAELDTFYVAEDLHQNYFENNRMQPYCLAVVAPKVAKFRRKFADRLKS